MSTTGILVKINLECYEKSAYIRLSVSGLPATCYCPSTSGVRVYRVGRGLIDDIRLV